MKERTRKLVLIGSVLGILLVVYAAYEACLFYQDRALSKKMQIYASVGDYESALSSCEDLHYWRESLCGSLKAAFAIKQDPYSQIKVCEDIPLVYDGPWWLPFHQKYIDDLSERRRTCITTLLATRS